MIVLGRQFLAAINLYKENYVKKNANFQKTLKVISKLIMLLKLLRKAYVVCTCIFNFFCIIDSMTFSGYCFVIIFHPYWPLGLLRGFKFQGGISKIA